MTSIGFLHTSPVHVSTFEALTHELAPGALTEHVVDAALLATARSAGIDAVADDVVARLDELAGRAVGVIVCTCSTIAPVAEAAGVRVPVVRVDRPMAQKAVEIGGRTGVVVAVESTVTPTRALLEEEARRAGTRPEIEMAMADGAWVEFEAGNEAAYLDLITETARAVVLRSDVVLLAQASMLGALRGLTDLPIPVLASPNSAVQAATELVDIRPLDHDTEPI